VVDIGARGEEASGQTRLLRAHLVAWTRVEQDAPANLAQVLDDTLASVVDQRLRVDVHRPVPVEEQFLFPGFDRTRDYRADYEEQVSFSRSDERPIPIDEVNPSVIANENIRRVDISVAENEIERPGLELSPKLFCPDEHLANARGMLSPEVSKLRSHYILELGTINEIQNVPDQCTGRKREGFGGKATAEIPRQPAGMNGVQRGPELAPLLIVHPGDHRVLAGDKRVENQAASST